MDGNAAPLLTDVAYALASKVTSRLISKASGWLGWGASAKASPEESLKSHRQDRPATEAATAVYPKFGLADTLREALAVAVSPNERLAAVTDSLGRVVLIDLHKGIAVRIWKGDGVP